MQHSRSVAGQAGSNDGHGRDHGLARMGSVPSADVRVVHRRGPEPSASLGTAAETQASPAPDWRRRRPQRDLALTRGVVRWALAAGLAVLACAFPASAGAQTPPQQQELTEFPPRLVLSGPLWDARSDGGTGAPVATDLPLTAQALVQDECIRGVQLLVNGQQMRSEHLVTYDDVCQPDAHTFTFLPRGYCLCVTDERRDRGNDVHVGCCPKGSEVPRQHPSRYLSPFCRCVEG